MSRLRAAAYATLVTVVAFYYLAAPTLRGLFGEVAVLPAYAGVALLAGAVTYRAIRFVSAYEPVVDDERDRLLAEADPDTAADADGQAADEHSDDPPIDEELDDPEVDEMLREIEGERAGESGSGE